MRLFFQYPTRSRPKLFQSTLKKYQDLLSGYHQITWHIECDKDDKSMNNPEMIAFLSQQPNLTYDFGQSKTKVEAINSHIPEDGWDILLLISDDMIAQLQNYDDIIAQEMEAHFPDLDGVLWFDDGGIGANKLCTLSIMGKKYYDRDKYIYNPAYQSLWCDNHQQDVAQSRGKLQYVPRVIIKHEWTNATGKDSLHLKNSKQSIYNKDEETYKNFKANGFPEIKAQKRDIILSILTPTLTGRKVLLDRLKAILEPQLINQPVEWLTDDSAPPVTIGFKRQALLEKAQGTYICFIDDDDTVSTDYVARILEAAKENSDVIGMIGLLSRNGIPDRPFIHSLRFKEWKTLPTHYERTPNHLNPVKREIAKKIGFKNISFGEDKMYSDGIKNLLSTETFIDNPPIYFYQHVDSISTSNNPSNRLKHQPEIPPYMRYDRRYGYIDTRRLIGGKPQ